MLTVECEHFNFPGKELNVTKDIYIYIYLKFKCSPFNVFCPDGITPKSGLTGPNDTIYIFIYIYVYIYI